MLGTNTILQQVVPPIEGSIHNGVDHPIITPLSTPVDDASRPQNMVPSKANPHRRKRRRKNKNRLNEFIQGIPRELDLAINFSQWFYSDITNKVSRSKTERCAERYADLQINEYIEPDRFKYLTQELHLCETPSLRNITMYKISLDELSNESPDKIVRELQESPVLDRTTPPPYLEADPKRLSLTIQPQRTIIDIRPMLKRRQRDVNSHDCPSGVDALTNVTSNSLIGPGEDCDDSDSAEEVIEIDCDTESQV